MKKVVFVLTIVLGILLADRARAQGAQDDSLDLQQVIDIVLQHQPKLDQIVADVEASRQREKEAKTALSPHISANAEYTRVDPVPTVSFNGNELGFSPNNNYNGYFDLQQMIYDFGRTDARLDLLKTQTMSQSDRKALVKWNVRYFTIQTFYSVLFLNESIRVENEQIQTLQQDLEFTKQRVERGSATDYEVLTTKVQIATERNRKVDLQNSLNKQKVVLRRLMGWQQGRPVHLKGSLDLSARQQNPALPDSVNPARRPDYKLLQDKEVVMQKKKALVDYEDKPELTGLVTAGVKNGYPMKLNEPRLNWAAGVHLKVPIFSGHLTDYKRREAEAQIRSVQAEQVEKKREINAQVQQASSDVKAGLNKLSTTDLQIKQATEKVKLAKVRYQNGVITNQDLLDSETALAQAKLSKVSAVYQVMLSEFRLQKALGTR